MPCGSTSSTFRSPPTVSGTSTSGAPTVPVERISVYAPGVSTSSPAALAIARELTSIATRAVAVAPCDKESEARVQQRCERSCAHRRHPDLGEAAEPALQRLQILAAWVRPVLRLEECHHRLRAGHRARVGHLDGERERGVDAGRAGEALMLKRV